MCADLVRTDNSTGTHSYYTRHRGIEIMMHVAPFLPHFAHDVQHVRSPLCLLGCPCACFRLSLAYVFVCVWCVWCVWCVCVYVTGKPSEPRAAENAKHAVNNIHQSIDQKGKQKKNIEIRKADSPEGKNNQRQTSLEQCNLLKGPEYAKKPETMNQKKSCYDRDFHRDSDFPKSRPYIGTSPPYHRAEVPIIGRARRLCPGHSPGRRRRGESVPPSIFGVVPCLHLNAGRVSLCESQCFPP